MQGSLPRDVIRYILSFFPLDALCLLGRVCKLWNEIAHHSSLWRKIDVSNFRNPVTDKTLQHVANRLQDNLFELKLSGCIYITDNGLNFMLSVKPIFSTITRLDLSNCVQISNATIRHLLSPMSVLKCLNLSFCWRIQSMTVVDAVVASRRALREIYLNECSDLTDSALMAIASNCPELESLCIFGCDKFTEAAVIMVLSQCKKLQLLDLGCCQVDGKTLRAIGENCRNLQKLLLYGCKGIEESHLVYVNQVQCPSLGYIELPTSMKAQSRFNLFHFKSTTKIVYGQVDQY